MNHLSLFSGMGGFDLAAEWMGWNNVAHCEWNPFCQQILKYYWPNAISYADITKTDFKRYRHTIDVLSGGFPCQGNSLAGNRLGTDDDRYLWPEMLRVIDETQPITVVGENVTGILSVEDRTGIYRDIFAKVENRTITRFHEVDQYEAIYTRQAKMLVNSICEDLEKRGYEVQTFAIPAAAVGAPHQRERIWFVADSKSKRSGGLSIRTEKKSTKYGVVSQDGHATYSTIQGLEVTGQAGIRKFSAEIGKGMDNRSEFDSSDATNSNGIGLRGQSDGIRESRFFNKEGEIYDWTNFPTQSPVCDGNDGFSSQLDGITFSKWRNESIKAGGNAIVPQVALQIFQTINQYEHTL